MNLRTRWLAVVALANLAIVANYTHAAGSFSDPLTSFDASKFTISPGAIPITYDAGGAHFGAVGDGDGSRNYQRTIAGNYAQAQSFVAEITVEVTDPAQDAYLGLGTGDVALFGTPDWSTQFSSASFWLEPRNDKFVRFRTANDVNSFADTGVPGFDLGVHRFRMSYDKSLNQLLGEIDLNYAGGPFVADAMTTNFPMVTTSLNAADGWPSEPSRIFFGGDDGVILRDFSINAIVPEPATATVLLVALGAFGFIRRGNR